MWWWFWSKSAESCAVLPAAVINVFGRYTYLSETALTSHWMSREISSSSRVFPTTKMLKVRRWNGRHNSPRRHPRIAVSCLKSKICCFTYFSPHQKIFCFDPWFISHAQMLSRDECLSNPCSNGGTCDDRYNGYTCRCPPNWTVSTWPSEKLPFECQKIAKNFHFFSKKLPLVIFLKKKFFLAIFFEKMSSFWQYFDSQMAIFRRVR